VTANWPCPGSYVGIPKDRRARHAGRDLLEQLQPFPADAPFKRYETGGVAARPRQAGDERYILAPRIARTGVEIADHRHRRLRLRGHAAAPPSPAMNFRRRTIISCAAELAAYPGRGCIGTGPLGLFAAVHESGSDAVDGSSTGT
jgi:hypothetical protein